MEPIPVHAVSGAPCSGKSAHIARFAELEPDSLGLVNLRVKDLPNLVVAPFGCPCCTARVALQVALARLVREHKPARIYIELPDPGHASALSAVLRQWPLSQYVAPGEVLEGTVASVMHYARPRLLLAGRLAGRPGRFLP